MAATFEANGSLEMTYQRDGAPKREVGTDQLVFERADAGWKLVWRCIHFEPAKPGEAA